MKIAIVGAGVSGLSAAYFLLKKDPALEVEVFEKSADLGGRVATQSIVGKCEVDTGCQYLSIDDETVLDFIRTVSPPNALRDLPGPIVCLPEGWIIEPKDRYYLAGGMNEWPRELAKTLGRMSSRFKLNLSHPVINLKVIWDRGFDAIFVSTPGPQGKHLGAEKTCDYWPCLGLVFSWHNPPREALEYYAFRDLVFRDGTIWLAHEGLKRQQSELWIAQLAPAASLSWRSLGADAIEDRLQADLADWFSVFEQGDKTLLDVKYWDLAFPAMSPDPTEQFPFERQASDPKHPLYFFGDGYLGVGRAENAIQSAAAVVEDFLKSRG